VIDSLSESSRLEIFVNWPAIENAGISRNTPITVLLNGATLRKVLDAVLVEADNSGRYIYIKYIIDDGVITISTREDLASEKYQEVRVYDIRPLLQIGRGPQSDRIRELITVIETTIEHDSWKSAGGTIGSIADLNGQLIVNQTRENHVAMGQFLKRLAKSQ